MTCPVQLLLALVEKFQQPPLLFLSSSLPLTHVFLPTIRFGHSQTYRKVSKKPSTKRFRQGADSFRFFRKRSTREQAGYMRTVLRRC